MSRSDISSLGEFLVKYCRLLSIAFMMHCIVLHFVDASYDQWTEIKAYYHYTCYYCHNHLNFAIIYFHQHTRRVVERRCSVYSKHLPLYDLKCDFLKRYKRYSHKYIITETQNGCNSAILSRINTEIERVSAITYTRFHDSRLNTFRAMLKLREKYK